MKKITLAMAFLAVVACKKTETSTVKDDGKVTTGVEAVQEQTKDEIDKIDVEKLKTATPATQAQLESVIPAEVNGVKKSDAAGIPMSQKQTAMATYMNGMDMSKVYTVMVVDAAGEDASKYQAEFEKYKDSEMAKDMQANANVSSEVVDGNRVFFNEIDMSGIKSVGANMMYKGRYAIVVGGTGLTKEQVKDIILKLDLSQLPD